MKSSWHEKNASRNTYTHNCYLLLVLERSCETEFCHSPTTLLNEGWFKQFL